MLLGITLSTYAQKRKKATAPTPPPVTAARDSAKPAEPGKPKPYKEVLGKNTVSQKGMFIIHRQDEQYLFEIPDSLLNRDILVVNRLSQAAAGIRPQVQIYAGDQIAENVIRFEKGPGYRILMKRMQFRESSKDTTENGLYRSVIQSNLQPIVASFPVKAYGGDSTGGGHSTVIDVTSMLQTENEIFHFSAEARKGLSLGGVQNDKSYVVSARSYPMNIEVRMMRTYQQGGASTSTLPVTYELNSSAILLPKVPMKGRYADARVGYFGRSYIDFDGNPQGVKEQAFITRWRLEPREEDKQKYLRGELVEPAHPIIYYIDPATPKKWVPYLIAGVNDWQKAFEQAGFKNAIKALPAPVGDSSWSMEDARHNVIVYKPSAIANASGPHVHDPRSGEIMETHINWYHNIMLLLRNWYMLQAGAIDARARTMHFDDSLMGQLIRFVSSHEVGHTLGLLHNYGSSSTVPVEKLRDKAWVEANGHTPSIMDYARFNYVAQPEDHITEKGIFPRIGAYDKWAIEWGYRWFPRFTTADAETAFLNKWIIDSLRSNKHLFFGSESASLDPRSQSEDLGDDAVLASTYGIKNLQRILPQLKTWTREPNEGYEGLKLMQDQLYRQYILYSAHVLKSIGGEYATPKSVEEGGAIFEPVPYQKQKAAMRFLDQYVFNIPDWIVSDVNVPFTKSDGAVYMEVAQSNALQRLQGSGVLIEFIQNEASGKKNVYTCTEFLNDLKTSVWKELYTNKPININRRKLQKTYILNTANAFKATGEIVGKNSGNGIIYYINPDPTRMDVSSMVRAHLVSLRSDIQKAIPLQKGYAKYHLQDMVQRINDILDPKKVIANSTKSDKALPVLAGLYLIC